MSYNEIYIKGYREGYEQAKRNIEREKNNEVFFEELSKIRQAVIDGRLQNFDVSCPPTLVGAENYYRKFSPGSVVTVTFEYVKDTKKEVE